MTQQLTWSSVKLIMTCALLRISWACTISVAMLIVWLQVLANNTLTSSYKIYATLILWTAHAYTRIFNYTLISNYYWYMLISCTYLIHRSRWVFVVWHRLPNQSFPASAQLTLLLIRWVLLQMHLVPMIIITGTCCGNDTYTLKKVGQWW